MSCCRSCSAGRSSSIRWRTAWGTGTSTPSITRPCSGVRPRGNCLSGIRGTAAECALAEPAGIADQSHGPACAGDAAGAGDEDQRSRALCRRLPGHAPVVASGHRRYFSDHRRLAGGPVGIFWRHRLHLARVTATISPCCGCRRWSTASFVPRRQPAQRRDRRRDHWFRRSERSAASGTARGRVAGEPGRGRARGGSESEAAGRRRPDRCGRLRIRRTQARPAAAFARGSAFQDRRPVSIRISCRSRCSGARCGISSRRRPSRSRPA